jgi:hypothetical protein
LVESRAGLVVQFTVRRTDLINYLLKIVESSQKLRAVSRLWAQGKNIFAQFLKIGLQDK